MSVTVKNNVTDAVNRIAKTVGGSVDKRGMMAIAMDAISAINIRTGLGQDENNAPFPAYTERGTYYAPTWNRPAGYPMPSGGRRTHKLTGRDLITVAYDGGYADYKAAIGRGARPQLSVSGEMLGDMVARSGDGWAEIFFATRLSQAKAHGHHVSGRFPFFGLNYQNLAEMHRDIIRLISESVKKEHAE